MDIEPQNYDNGHLKQLSILFKKGYHSQISLQNCSVNYLVPSLLACRMYEQSTIQVMRQQRKDPLSLMWYIAGSHMIGMNYEQQMEELKQKKEQKYIEMLEDWTTITKPLSHKKQVKALLRKQYEKHLQKAEEQNYFTIKNIPVFLISFEWLQSFFNDSMDYIPAINNREICQPMPFVDTDPQYMHFNYKIKEEKRQNVDFKLVSFETWKFLKNKFGGVEVRRFNTPEKEPCSQLWLKEIRVMVTENRYIHTNWELKILASKFETLSKIIERVQRLLIAYNMIDFPSLKKKWEIIKVTNIETEDLVDLIQDQNKQLSKDFQINEGSKIERLEYIYNVEESEIYNVSDILLLTINTDESEFICLDKIPYLKVLTSRQSCLTCEKTDDLFQCTCKTVYFCCKQCKIKNREHQKICKALLKEESQLGNLLDFYSVKKKVLQYENVKKYGKIGFQNLGNTCYFNSALQCVLAIDRLNSYFAENNHLSDINVSNVLGSEGHLACAYGQLVKDYYSTNRRSLEPIKVLKIISKNSQFRGHAQQDSQQFLNYFLDKLHQDLNRVKKKPIVDDIQSDGRLDEIVSKESWENYLKRNQSFISETFAGQYRSEIQCPDCDRVSITFDPYMSVTLPFPKQQKKIEVKGYYMTLQGEFRKVQVHLKASMQTTDFIKKYFHVPVEGQWLVEKKPSQRWKNNKSLYYNDSTKGILLFYEKPQDSTIKLDLQIEGYKIFNRRIYEKSIQTQEELLKLLYTNLKKPLLKAMKDKELVQMQTQQYLQKCLKMGFIEITEGLPEEFPMKVGEFDIKIKINLKKVEQLWEMEKQIKFDVSSQSYTPKEQIKTRSISDQISVSSLIQSFNEPQRLTQQNSWYCNKCKEHKLAQKTMSIYSVPKYLIIHLKRFNHKGNRYVIYGQKVKTPINLEPIQIINGEKYELISLVNHFGTLSFGHYTASIKRQNQWFYCDDSSVRRSNISGNDAYLLFYKRLK